MTGNTPLRTLLVDDEPLAIQRLKTLCGDAAGLTIIGAASNGIEALSMIDALQPDLVILDIAMPELDGLAVARSLSALASPPALIFVTAFADFAVEAFDTPAVDYVLKPVAKDRLERAVGRASTAVDRRPDVEAGKSAYASEFWVPHRSQLVRISADEIQKIEAERDYMRLFVEDRSYLLHQTISALEARLDPASFIRLHRSTIVRQDRVARLGHDGAGAWHAELVNGEHVRIGRTYLKQAKALAGK